MTQQNPPSESEQTPHVPDSPSPFEARNPAHQASPYGANQPLEGGANPYAPPGSPSPSGGLGPGQYGSSAGAPPQAQQQGDGFIPVAQQQGIATEGRLASPYGPPQGGYASPNVVPASASPGVVGVGTVANQVAEYIEVPGHGAVRLASISQRLVARLLDSVIIAVVSGILLTLLAVVSSLIVTTDDGSGNAVLGGFAIFIVGALVIVVIAAVYEVVMIGLWGATLGKMIMKVKVVKPRNGEVPGIGAAFMRVLIPAGVTFLLSLIPFIGPLIGGFGAIICYLSATFDSSGRRQGWHDKVANTVVTTSA